MRTLTLGSALAVAGVPAARFVSENGPSPAGEVPVRRAVPAEVLEITAPAGEGNGGSRSAIQNPQAPVLFQRASGVVSTRFTGEVPRAMIGCSLGARKLQITSVSVGGSGTAEGEPVEEDLAALEKRIESALH